MRKTKIHDGKGTVRISKTAPANLPSREPKLNSEQPKVHSSVPLQIPTRSNDLNILDNSHTIEVKNLNEDDL